MTLKKMNTIDHAFPSYRPEQTERKKDDSKLLKARDFISPNIAPI
jgi:hypothetical protein